MVAKHKDKVAENANQADAQKISTFFQTAPPKGVEEAIKEFILGENMPFSLVEKPLFRAMLSACNPKAPKVTRNKMVNWITIESSKAKDTLKTMITGEDLAVTCDH